MLMGGEEVKELSKSTDTDTAVGAHEGSLPQAPTTEPLSSTHETDVGYTDDTKLWTVLLRWRSRNEVATD